MTLRHVTLLQPAVAAVDTGWLLYLYADMLISEKYPQDLSFDNSTFVFT